MDGQLPPPVTTAERVACRLAGHLWGPILASTQGKQRVCQRCGWMQMEIVEMRSMRGARYIWVDIPQAGSYDV